MTSSAVPQTEIFKPKVFLLVPQSGTTQREKELVDATKKSHAARYAHDRRRTRRTTAPFRPIYYAGSSLKPTGGLSRDNLKDVYGCQDDSDFRKLCSLTLSPPSLHKNETFDPFSAFPVAFSCNDHSFLRYFLRFGGANIRRAEAMAKSQSLELDTCRRPFVEDMIFVVLTHEASTYALLGITAARLSLMNAPYHNYQQQATYYMVKALSTFRRDLADSKPAMQSELIKVMFHLASAEWYREDHQAARIHMKSIAGMLGNNFESGTTIMGGTYFMSNMSRYDIMMAVEWNDRPLLHPPPRLPPMNEIQYANVRQRLALMDIDIFCGMSMGLKPKDVATHEDHILHRKRPFFMQNEHPNSIVNFDLPGVPSQTIRDRFASGFLELAQHDGIGVQFSTFLLSFFPQWSDMLILCFSNRHGASSEDAAWFDERTNTALYDLLFLQEHTQIYPRQEALRLALIMILTDMTSPVHWRAVSAILIQLRTCLELLEAMDGDFEKAYYPSTIEGSMMLWILCMAICAAAAAAADQQSVISAEKLEWWKKRVVNLCMGLRIYRLSDLFMVLARYLHCGLIQHSVVIGTMRIVADRVDDVKVSGASLLSCDTGSSSDG